jgi:hypothetical protein
MMMISPFGQLGLWITSSGERDAFSSAMFVIRISVFRVHVVRV